MAQRRKTGKTSGRKGRRPAVRPAVQEALQITWVLKGHLKNAQISYLRVGRMLADVRERKLYAELGHPDIETYAEQRLRLGRASLYRYLKVYEWVRLNHKEWIEPKPKGFIPDLADVAGLIWIENELQQKEIKRDTRAVLEDLRKKALDGDLKKAELEGFRKSTKRGDESLRSFLSMLRRIRKRGAKLVNMPDEVISHLDAAIGILKNMEPVQMARLEFLDAGRVATSSQNILS